MIQSIDNLSGIAEISWRQIVFSVFPISALGAVVFDTSSGFICFD